MKRLTCLALSTLLGCGHAAQDSKTNTAENSRRGSSSDAGSESNESAHTIRKRLVRTGKVTTDGPRSPEAVEETAHQHRGRTILCYETALKRVPTLTGTVTMKYAITADGDVTNAKPSSTLHDDEVVACIISAFERYHKYPKAEGKETLVTYPIVFGPEE